MPISISGAEFIWSVSNYVLVASLVLGVLATFGIVVSGNVKEAALKRELASAGAAAAKAIQEAAEINVRAADLEKKASDARLETEKIKREASWRGLSDDQQSSIRDVLVKHPMEITIAWTAGDPESAMFANHLASSFVNAGAKIVAFAPFALLGGQQYGLTISGSESDELSVLEEALAKAGLAPNAIHKDARKADGTKYVTHLFVGYRNPPDFSFSASH